MRILNKNDWKKHKLKRRSNGKIVEFEDKNLLDEQLGVPKYKSEQLEIFGRQLVEQLFQVEDRRTLAMGVASTG